MRLVVLVLLVAASSPAKAQTPPAWRIGTGVALAAADGFAYAGGTAAIERYASRRLWVGVRAARSVGPLADVDCFDLCPRIEQRWTSAEGTVSAEAVSGGMALHATVGAGGSVMVGANGLTREDRRVVPMLSAGLGLDVYPVRRVGVGVRVDAVARSLAPGAQVSAGLRVRLGG
ncbi:hypothetical protein [Rubrivirga sp. IMCC43871]|uniref:hypothetical protein n=1 Tax=Rubrivirga sp. IMCC43871 TaxID=3391575 RepID=UPI00398FA898